MGWEDIGFQTEDFALEIDHFEVDIGLVNGTELAEEDTGLAVVDIELVEEDIVLAETDILDTALEAETDLVRDRLAQHSLQVSFLEPVHIAVAADLAAAVDSPEADTPAADPAVPERTVDTAAVADIPVRWVAARGIAAVDLTFLPVSTSESFKV